MELQSIDYQHFVSAILQFVIAMKQFDIYMKVWLFLLYAKKEKKPKYGTLKTFAEIQHFELLPNLRINKSELRSIE